MKISLAFSPCPNDTFIFFALVHEKIDLEGLEFDFLMEDVETLNHMALKGEKEMIKVSYHAWLYIRENYSLLDAGSALGSGNGPLLISKHNYRLEDIPHLSVAIPGEYTTAHLLLNMAAPIVGEKQVMIFSGIEEAILDDRVDCGVIIHENRFTYESKGLKKILDLGEYWEKLTHSPIPLGGIVVKKSLGKEISAKLNRIMKRSVQYAFDHPEEAMPFVRQHAREMDQEVMKKHIQLYVNAYTLDLGDQGKAAVQKLVNLSTRKT